MSIPIRDDGPPKDRTYRPPAPKTETVAQYRARHAFYCRVAWKRCRAVQLRANPFCNRCREQSIFTPADHVHHIIDLADAPELAYEPTNLECLCVACHSSETTRRRMSQRKE